MQVSFGIKGADSIVKELNAMGEKTERIVAQKALFRGAKIISKRAKENTVKDTRRLSASIGIMKIRGKILKYEVGSKRRKKGRSVGSSYAHMVEFGTIHTPARPFLRPALDEKKEEAINAVGQALWDGITKELKAI